MTDCRDIRRWIDEAFVVGPAGIDPRRWDAVRTHAAGCDACRRRFERLAALAPTSPSGLSGDAVERIARAVVPRPPRRVWAVWGTIGLVGAAAAALILVLWARPPHERQRDSFQPRGTPWAGERPPGARLYCVVPQGARRQVVAEVHAAEAPLPVPSLACKLDATLQITYSTPSLEGMTMVAFSRDSSGRIYWYAPHEALEPAVPVAPDVRDQALEWSTRLGVKHAAGRYAMTVMFFDRQVSGEDAVAGRVPPTMELRATLLVEEP